MRTATSADLPEIRRVLAEAFAADPMVPWIFPDGEHRLEATSAWPGLFAERYVHHGRAGVEEEGDGVLAVALRRWPDQLPSAGSRPADDPGAARRPGRPRTGQRARRRPGGDDDRDASGPLRLSALLGGRSVPSATRPRPARAGAGSGRGTPAVTACVSKPPNPDNLAFYRSLGFAVTGHLRFDFGGPELWASGARRAEPREVRRLGEGRWSLALPVQEAQAGGG